MKETNFNSSKDAIQHFNTVQQHDDEFVKLLELSLVQAKGAAQQDLDHKLFDMLDWPTNVDAYVDYLTKFSKWAPQQSDNPAWNNPDNGTSQEVYDKLCHFYFLIDQKLEDYDNLIVQNIPWFSNWLVEYADLWGSYLNTPESFSPEILNTFIKYSPEYRVQDSMIEGRPNEPWNCFNEFFARKLNPGLRPVDGQKENKIITTPADCTYRNTFSIDANSQIEEITIKKTHKFASIEDLLEGSEYKSAFANGTFVHYFLGPYSYHRFHTPVNGIIKECYPVKGLVYLDVDIKNKQFDAPDSSKDGYEFSQARGILTIDTRNSPYGDMGIVAVIPIGMAQVSSVKMTAEAGKEVAKGEEFGHFLFGGSDIIMLFQEGKAPMINDSTNYRHYGMDISKCPPPVDK